MGAATAIVIAAGVAGCSRNVARTPEPRPVRTLAVEYRADGEVVSFTGQIRARDQFNLAFRLDGRVIERHANLGDVIAAGQVVARLDSQNQQNALRSAEANLAAAQAALTEARLTFGRQQASAEGERDAACEVRQRPGGAAHGRSQRSTRPRPRC